MEHTLPVLIGAALTLLALLGVRELFREVSSAWHRPG
jgi:hypothetical protein